MALRLPQPGHWAPKTVRKRHGGKKPAVAGSNKKRTAMPAHARKVATRRVYASRFFRAFLTSRKQRPAKTTAHRTSPAIPFLRMG